MDDSGKRKKSKSGAIKDLAEGKPMPGLISPFAQMREGMRLAKAYKDGKYPLRNWESGMPFSWIVESLERHIQQYKMGMDDEDHLAAIRCYTGFLIHYEEMIKRDLLSSEFCDMPFYLKRKETKNERG